MPTDKELALRDDNKNPIPIEAELITDRVPMNNGFDEAIDKLSELTLKAFNSLMNQNFRDADIAARTAEALYDELKQNLSRDQLLVVVIRKNLISLIAPLIQSTILQMEGRLTRSIDELAKGLVEIDDGITSIEEYSRLTNVDKAIIQIKPIFLLFRVLFKGTDAVIRAEIVGYQGNIPKYIELLQEAVTVFRQEERIPQSLDESISNLHHLCASFAERYKTRIEVFSSEQGKSHPFITGNKIFIIHGHEDLVWHELRDFLKEEFKLDTIVLKEEPGAGETLIQKFEEFANDCCYAFALLTPDDFVGEEGPSYFQPRPNVLFELGWFYGRFGRDRVCIVKKAETKMPSDLGGILSIDFRDNVSEGFFKIQKELKRVGVIPGKPLKKRRQSNGRAKKQNAAKL